MHAVIHMDGHGEDEFPVECFSELYNELFVSGIVDGEVSVIDDASGWSLSAHRDGRIVFEHLGGQGGPMHMIPVPKARVIELWKRLVHGDLASIMTEPWRAGYVDK
jgi:hypothetical protein